MPRILRFTAILFALSLSGCADTEWPHWITGEPTREELNAYKGPIEMPAIDVADKRIPNLAEVPPSPKILMKKKEEVALRKAMKQDNENGNAESDAYAQSLAAQPAPQPVKKK